MGTFNISCADFSRQRILDIVSRAELHDPVQAAVDYARLHERAIYMNTLLHAWLGYTRPFGSETDVIAGRILGLVAIKEGGTEINTFTDSHAVKARQFVQNIADAAGREHLPAPTDVTDAIVRNIYPDLRTLTAFETDLTDVRSLCLVQLGRTLAAKHSATRGEYGKDIFGIVAQLYISKHTDIWNGISSRGEAWLFAHTSKPIVSTEETLDEIHLEYAKGAVDQALEYCLRRPGECPDPQGHVLNGVLSWYASLERFFTHWVTL